MIGEIGFFLSCSCSCSGFGGGYLLTKIILEITFLNQTEMQKKITELTFIFALLSFLSNFFFFNI